MKSAKGRRKRKTGAEPKTQVLSTSEARAHFAAALETAYLENAVIGFDRYGRTVAALVPVDAVYILAGLGGQVPAATRKAIQAGAARFARNVPYQTPEAAAPHAAGKRPANARKKKAAGRRKRA